MTNRRPIIQRLRLALRATSGPQRVGSSVSSPLTVLVVTLAFTGFAWFWSTRAIDAEAAARFAQSVSLVGDAIRFRMETYQNTLLQTRGFLKSDRKTSRDEFRGYIDNLDILENYPGIQGIGFTRRLAPEELAEHVAAMRASGLADYGVFPDTPRSEYNAIVFLEPLDWRNQRAIGYDMATDPVRREAMDRARDTGLPAMSGTVILIQEVESGRQPGFLLYVPIYTTSKAPDTVAERRANLVGFVYSPFRAHDLFRNIAREHRDFLDLVSFEVYDDEADPEDALIFDSDGPQSADDGVDEPRFQQQITTTTAGRKWRIKIFSRPSLEAMIPREIPFLLLALGSIASLLVYRIQQTRLHQTLLAHNKRFLAEASNVLASTLDFDATLRRVARLSVPEFADWCTVDVLNDQGKLDRLVVEHSDEDKVAEALEFHRLNPAELKSDVGYGRVLATGEPEIVEYFSSLAPEAQPPEHLAMLKDYNMKSWIICPLKARGKTLGVVSFVLTDSDRTYAQGDVTLAKDLARYAALAMDNARLHDETQKARDELAESYAVLDALFSAAPIGMAYLDTDFRYKRMNRYLATLHRATPKSAVGRTIWDVSPSFAAELVPYYQRVLDERRVVKDIEFEGEDPRYPGENHIWNTTYFPIIRSIENTDKSEAALGLGVISIDVTERRKAQLAIERSEQRYRTLVSATTSVVWTGDNTGRFVVEQPSWSNYTGQSWEDYKDFGWLNAIHPDDRQRIAATWSEGGVDQGANETQGRIWHQASQSYRHFISRAVALRDDTGEHYEWIGTITDIHQRKMAEERLIEERRLVERLNEIGRILAAEIRLDRLVQQITDITTELTGAAFGAFFYNVDADASYMLYTLSGVPRESFSRFPMPSKTAIFAPTFDGVGIVRRDDVTKDPLFGKNPPYNGLPKGHLPVRSYLAAPVMSRSGTVLGGLFFGHPEVGVFTERSERLVEGIAAQAAIAIDNAQLFAQAEAEIKKRAEAEEALLALNETLEQKVADRTSELAQANRELESFSYSVSHDLRAPLRAIDGFSSLLEAQYAKQIDATGKDYLNRVRSAAQRMSRLIDDMLDLSRITRREMVKTSVNLSNLAAVVGQELGERHPDQKVQFDVEPDIVVHGDEVLLRAVLENLIGNAWKFTSRHDSARIAFGRTERDHHPVYFVRDDGAGFDMRYADKLFGAFQRLHSEAEFEGTGVGLASVHRVIKRHGGEIWAESAPGRGATFFFSLPG